MIDTTKSRSDLRAKIVDVAARLLQQDGPAAVTTRGVAEGAGVQAPTIYRLFGDKDGLLDAVAEHVMATFVGAKAVIVGAAAADNVDPLEDLRAGWDMQIDFGVANPTLFSLLSDPNRGQHSPAAQAGKRMLAERVHRIAVAGRLRVSEERAVELIHAAGTGAILTILSTPPEHRDPSLALEMWDAIAGQIFIDEPVPSDGGTISTAVALRSIAPQLDVLSVAERQLLAEWLDRVIGRR